jgi:hypothetical protein
MPKPREVETRTQRTGRIDTVKPPDSLPDASPLERMTELTRRIVGVPKDEAVPPKKRPKRKH